MKLLLSLLLFGGYLAVVRALAGFIWFGDSERDKTQTGRTRETSDPATTDSRE